LADPLPGSPSLFNVLTVPLQGGSAEVELVKGNMITLTTDESRYEDGDINTIFVDYKNITKVVSPGKKVYVDDGLISLVVREIGECYYCT